MRTHIAHYLLSALIGVVFTAKLAAQTTAFTYQGRLIENGQPFTGTAEFQFTLWDAESGGMAVATNDPPQVVIPVSNGLFTVELDFGTEGFDGTDRHLQIEVRTTIGSFITLSPRQLITPSPEAVHATSADTALEAMTVDTGMISNPTFIGTTATNAPLDLSVNNQRALRLEDTGGDTNNDGNPDGAPNVIGGAPVNSVAPGIVGATIGGGGATDLVGFPEPNTVEDNYGTVGGGVDNTAGRMAFVGGGRSNTASGDEAVVGGGLANRASDQEATVAGGSHNTASGGASLVGGGNGNFASGTLSAIGGGSGNTASGGYSTVPGGVDNTAAGSSSFAAGRAATANHRGAFVWADSDDGGFTSIQDDEFAIRAANGVRIANSGHDAELLRFDMDRDWHFRQYNSGASAALELSPVDATNPKNFILKAYDVEIDTYLARGVGINRPNPQYTLHVNGNVAGVGDYHNVSDRRYKKDIRPLTGALETVCRLQGVSFDWRREEHPDMQFEEGRHLGFIAQDLQRVVPEAVSETEDSTLHAAYAQVIPLLVEAVKEQNRELEIGRLASESRKRRSQASIEQLKAENAELKARLETLERLVHSLNR